METATIILRIAVILSAVITLGYVIAMCLKKQVKRAMLVGGMMIICPILGPFIFAVSYLLMQIFKRTNVAFLSREELSFNREKVKVQLGDDLQRGLNKVPVEEALLESSNENMRRVLLDVLKTDIEGAVPILVDAVNSEDSEVSHYASSALSDVLAKFKRSQKKYDELYWQNEFDQELLKDYTQLVLKYLSFGILSDMEQNQYLDLYEKLMRKRHQDFKEGLAAEEYEEWILLLAKSGRPEQANKWLSLLNIAHPVHLATWRAKIKFYYGQQDYVLFEKTIRDIKNSSVFLDAETLEIVRYFQFID
ncbi:hypothetical protein Q5O24_02920 [Eubacteriaceae bacterium ES3]|nr:hypothetical protein Q5O24_02920 [Eubacteriaceae bacterium ES3]